MQLHLRIKCAISNDTDHTRYYVRAIASDSMRHCPGNSFGIKWSVYICDEMKSFWKNLESVAIASAIAQYALTVCTLVG